MPNNENPDSPLQHLLDNNRAWASGTVAQRPDFFTKLSTQQNPEYMWIGCADSRVPANELIGLLPGEVFVHRNVANVLVHSDLNCLSTLQYAIDVLQVKHIIICGHYGCGGVMAAANNLRFGLVDNWLRHVHDVKHKYATLLTQSTDDNARVNLLCELNVIEQVHNAAHTTVLQDAWARGQSVTVHGWIYNLRDGLLQSLGLAVTHHEQLAEQYQTVMARIAVNMTAGKV